MHNVKNSENCNSPAYRIGEMTDAAAVQYEPDSQLLYASSSMLARCLSLTNRC